MAWETGIGLIAFASVYSILKICSIMKPKEDNSLQSSLVNGLKSYLVIITLLIILGSVALIPPMMDASINPADTTAIDNVKIITNTFYRTLMFTLIPVMFFMLIYFIYVLGNSFTGKRR